MKNLNRSMSIIFMVLIFSVKAVLGSSVASGEERACQQAPRLPELPLSLVLNAKNKVQPGGEQCLSVRTVLNSNARSEYIRGRTYATLSHKPSPNWEATLFLDMLEPDLDKDLIAQYGVEDSYIEVFTEGVSDFLLYVPSGYVPIAPEEESSFRIKLELGGYRIHMNQPSEVIEIGIVKAPKRNLKLLELKTYTSKVLFDKNEISSELKKILKKTQSSDALSQAKAIEEYIAQKFRFDHKVHSSRTLSEVLSARKANAVMAAHLMVTLLRNNEVASRTVQGLRSRIPIGEDGEIRSLVQPDQVHSWVEVFAKGEWTTFDPTPLNRGEAQESQALGYEYFQTLRLPSPQGSRYVQLRIEDLPGDFRKSCHECSLDQEGRLDCSCKDFNNDFRTASIDKASDCGTIIENSNGIFGCLIAGDYMESHCHDCHYLDQNDDFSSRNPSRKLRCDCYGRLVTSGNLVQGSNRKTKSCKYVSYEEGRLVCKWWSEAVKAINKP